MATVKALDSPDLYTVGWIAALPIERAAATAMLDERHDKPSGFVQHQADKNSYTWGRIGEHNVVVASLPAGSYGTVSAATTASNLLSSLPQIRIGLLVGIGGGISRPEQGRDIRLGDVVVSQPDGTTGGVIQYDFVKAKPNQKLERKGSLCLPPLVLLHALANLQAEHELGLSRVPEFLKAMPQKRTPIANGRQGENGYIHQGFENDRLFKSSYTHVAGHNCRACDTMEEVERDQRDSTDPEIHYGIIVSGNMLVKDATTRDKLVEDIGEECICFEMEAAGLMNHFPCLVIRGICDYADSHKNDRWQRYAAATAASYAKELLGYVPTTDLQETQRALDVLKSMGEDIKNMQSVTSDTKLDVEVLKSDNHVRKIKKWLSPPDTSTNLNEAQKKQHKGTGSWFLESRKFKEWKSGTHRYLWLHGIPGCGKTILSATIINYLNQQADSSPIVLDFFFDFNDKNKQSLENLVRSLLAQLYSRCKNSRKELDKLFLSCNNGEQQPTSESLFSTFLQMVYYVEKTQIVIDALDECNTRKDLLLWMENLASSGHTGLYLLTTSRKEEDIESGLRCWLHQESFVPIQRDPVNHDIRAYVHERLRNDVGFKRWHSATSVQDEIETELMKKADGMFRWAACQLDILQDCLDLRMLRKSLRSLPKTLEETYARILAGISESYQPYAIRLLQFLTYSERPLTVREAVDAIAVDPSGDPPFDPRMRMPESREITKICSSLVSLVTRLGDCNSGEMLEELQLAHFSVQQYLKSGRIEASFPGNLARVASITKVCLAYLSHLDEQRPIKDVRVEFPLAQYSARYWMDHARSVETEEDLPECILKFFLEQPHAYAVWGRLFNPDRPQEKVPRQHENMATPLYYTASAGLHNALQAASRKGYKEIVWILLDHGADVNAQGGYYNDSLQAASYGGHKEIMQTLLDHGAKVNSQGGHYNTALQAASYKGHRDILQLLLDHGADVNAQGGVYSSALQAASYNGHREIMQLLLDHGADVNAQDGDYNTALQAASYKGHKEDVNAQGGDYGNALQAASHGGYKEIGQILLEHGAELMHTIRRYGNDDAL
ncbi:purine and uridine phosphorylase [Aspergillus granulosus]|uniref:Purine and uridine phosphorylase n=1 Tax=Aspergillus granulosus TaxID=176169 RepID=A0ABR4HUM1_9EURO